MRHLFSFIIIGIFYLTPAFGQKNTDAEEEYLMLVEKVQNGNNQEDFDNLRKIFTRTNRYTPYSGPEIGWYSSLENEIKNSDWKNCISTAKKTINYNYTNIDAHVRLRYCLAQTGEKDDFHLKIISGLVEAIKRTGDGLSPKTAYKTTSVSELHSFLKLSNLYYKEQNLIRDKELGMFDLIKAIDRSTQKEVSLYFDINLQMSKLSSAVNKIK